METEYENPKQRAIMETGRRLFWKYGFRRVNVDEICREAGVSKMTFYRFFENKKELAKTIYENEVRIGVERFDIVMRSDMSPSDKLKAIITMKLEGTNDMSKEFLMDFYKSNDTGLKAFVEDLTERSWNEIIKSFRDAQEKGWLRKDFKPEFILYLTQHLIPMLTDENLIKLYDTPQELILEFANFFTYGISQHD
ncbi:MAG: TetR/AcrR family transcriptional regulator [Bacteroidales bacterium]|nr:TetR/AcrR family transcriptional regulator [Bacteroidales bacterium]